jgi:hypothetical protein
MSQADSGRSRRTAAIRLNSTSAYQMTLGLLYVPYVSRRLLLLLLSLRSPLLELMVGRVAALSSVGRLLLLLICRVVHLLMSATRFDDRPP